VDERDCWGHIKLCDTSLKQATCHILHYSTGNTVHKQRRFFYAEMKILSSGQQQYCQRDRSMHHKHVPHNYLQETNADIEIQRAKSSSVNMCRHGIASSRKFHSDTQIFHCLHIARYVIKLTTIHYGSIIII